MKRQRNARRWGAVGAAAAVMIAAAGCSLAEGPGQELGQGASAAEAHSDPSGPAGESGGGSFEADYYTVTGPAQRDYQVSESGEIQYCPTDHLDRAECAYGELNSLAGSDSEGIDFDPPGWADNEEVTIEALPTVEGSDDYSGWFYNRSHLVADSLGGGEVPENMVTGTRTQNVGSTRIDGEYAGGMAYTERIAREYLASQQAGECPLYYAATPQYRDDELVPRTVTVDIASCDGGIDQRVEVSNTASGFSIDYATGAWSQDH